MSQFPQYPQQASPYSVPYASGGGLPVNRRPASVTTLAIIGIVLAAFWCLCSGPGLYLNAVMAGNGGVNPLAPRLPRADHTLIVFSIFQCVMNLVSALIMLFCCIGALYLKPLARKVIMPWSWVTLCWSIILLAVYLAWAGPIMERMTPRGNFPAALQYSRHVGRMIGMALTCAVMASMPICFLVFWNKPHVKAAFGERIAGTTNYYPPMQYPPGQNPPQGGGPY